MHGAIIEKLSKIESEVTNFNDVLERETDDARKDLGIIDAEDMQKHIEGLAKEGRLLTIGIIGRVNAGKSSLLNSVFFEGESVLPKAATPMTASLAIMTHGDSYSATVEYFSQKDRDKIKSGYEKYKKEWDRLFKEATKPDDSLAGKAMGILNRDKPDVEEIRDEIDDKMSGSAYAASYQQFQLMEKFSPAPDKDEEKLSATTREDLMGKLEPYVGSSGNRMPYTKSVQLQLPIEDMRDIRIVDTPGINDPVRSREERTEDFVKECDVVFVIIPAGQLLSSDDINLMTKLSTKEGVTELYIVASQADSQLFGSVLDESRGDLHKAVAMLSDNLGGYAFGVLEKVKKNSPEIGGLFDQLLKGGMDRFILTSAICHALRLKYDNPSSWDDDGSMELALRNLREDYPDYFDSDSSAKGNLELLSGVGKVNEKIAVARSQKDKIFKQRQTEYINGQAKKVGDYLNKLISEVNNKLEMIRNTDLSAIAAKKKQTEILVNKGTDAVDTAYENCMSDFKRSVRTIIDSKAKSLFEEAANKNANAEEIRHETVEWTTGWWLWKKKHSKINEIRTLLTGSVKATLNDLVGELEQTIIRAADDEKEEWKKSVRKKVFSALWEVVGDDNEQIDDSMLSTEIRRLVNSLELPILDLGSHRFHSSFSATIKNDDIDIFDGEVKVYLSDLKIAFNRAMDGFLRGMEQSVKGQKLSYMLFSGLRKEIEAREGEIQNKERIIDRLTKCAAAFRQIR